MSGEQKFRNVQPPRYWRDETGPDLQPAVELYLSREPLSPEQIELLRLYCEQWIDSPVWEANPHMTPEARRELDTMRRKAHAITTRADLDQWSESVTEAGLDPW